MDFRFDENIIIKEEPIQNFSGKEIKEDPIQNSCDKKKTKEISIQNLNDKDSKEDKPILFVDDFKRADTCDFRVINHLVNDSKHSDITVAASNLRSQSESTKKSKSKSSQKKKPELKPPRCRSISSFTFGTVFAPIFVPPLECNISGNFSSSSQLQLEAHLESRSNINPLKILPIEENCVKKNETENKIAPDSSSTNRSPKVKKPFKCCRCKFATRSKSVLILHKEIHKKNRRFCKLVERTPNAKANLNTPKVRQHTDEAFKCEICEFHAGSKTGLTLHVKSHNGNPFKCSSCDFVTQKRSSLKVHEELHVRDKQFKCESCDYATNRKYLLSKHKLKHSGEQFKCDICQYSSVLIENLRIHMRQHDKKKVFKCKICHFTYSANAQRKRHMRLHENVKPFKCDLCDFAAIQKCNLKYHILKTHFDENFNK